MFDLVCFNCLDFGKSGSVNKYEVATIISMHKKRIEHKFMAQPPEIRAAEIIETCFNELDFDKDGTMSFDEFKLVILKYPDLVKAFGMDERFIKAAGLQE